MTHEVAVRGVHVVIEVWIVGEDRWRWRFTAANGLRGECPPELSCASELTAYGEALGAAYAAVSRATVDAFAKGERRTG